MEKAGKMISQEPREGKGSRKVVSWCDVTKKIGSLDLTTSGLKVRFNRGSWGRKANEQAAR